MKYNILNMFAAKKISFEEHAHNQLFDITTDRLGGTFDFTLNVSGPYEEERIEIVLQFNYLYHEFIDTCLCEFIYYDNDGNAYDLSNDLQIDLAFDKFLTSNL